MVTASQFCFRFRFCDSTYLGSRNLHAEQLFAKDLNPRLRYYYFLFLKMDVLHVGILLPVLIFTFVSPSACHFAFACQISYKLDHPRNSYGVISVFKDGGHGIAVLLPVLFLVNLLIWEHLNLSAYQISMTFLNLVLRY